MHSQASNGGPLNDHVHYHKIRFQMIYVNQDWVRLLYGDQGPSFVLHGGNYFTIETRGALQKHFVTEQIRDYLAG